MLATIVKVFFKSPRACASCLTRLNAVAICVASSSKSTSRARVKTLLDADPALASSRDASGVSVLMRAFYRFDKPLIETVRRRVDALDILEVLERNNGNRTKTARDLGVDPRTIFRYLERETDAPDPAGPTGTLD